MKNEIAYKTLGEICENLDSKRVPITKSKREKGPIPYYGASGIVDYVKDYLFEEDLLLVSEDGANLLARTYPIAFSVEGKIWVNNHAHVLRFDNIVSQKFIEYYLNSIKLDEYVSGMAQPKLNQRSLKSIFVPFPPLPEQKQIVALLDAAFAKIDQAQANIERNIANAEELFQAKLNAVFSRKGEGWEERTLIEVASEFGRGKSKHRPRNANKLFGGKYPFVQTGDIRNADKYVTSYSQTYNEIGLAQSKLWKKGTICITIAANIAETAILNFDSCFPDSVIGFVVNPDKATNDYAYYSLLYLKTELQAQGKGSAQDNINLGTFKRQLFPFPIIKEQKEIVNVLDELNEKINNVIDKYLLKSNALTELKKSLLQKAFAGELTR